MQPRIYISFKTNIDDHSIGDDSNDTSFIPSGSNVIKHIQNKLQGDNIITTMPRQHSFYGWAFIAEYAGVKFYCLLQETGSWLLTTRPILRIVDKILFRKKNKEHRLFSEMIVKKLNSDSDFTEIKLRSQKEFDESPSL
jgi:hypothetical protein